MEPVKKILVSLDLSSMDSPLISYASYLARVLQVEEVIFFHAIQAYDLANRKSSRFPDLETELSGIIKERINERVSDYFNDHIKWSMEIEVGYEHAADEVVRFANEGNFDLILLGQKRGENRRGVYAQKIVSEIETNIMLVPEYVEHKLKSILCALDFSEYSRKAFEWGLEHSKRLNSRLSCYYITDPRRAFFPVSTQQSTYREEQRNRKVADNFLADYQLTRDDVTCHIRVHDQLTNEAETIYETAEQEGDDLIVVGAYGNTSNITSLLGNLTETFRLMEKEIPVAIIKR